jgi:hypothetical protein
VAGYTSSGDYDFALARYHNMGTSGIKTISNQHAEVFVFPNPFLIQATIRTEKSLSGATLQVFNSLGQEVTRLTNLSGQAIIISRDNLGSGIYYFQLFEANQVVTTGEFQISD